MLENAGNGGSLYKLVVVSDVHHDIVRLKRILPVINSANYLIFCGDGLDSVMRARGSMTVPLLCVRGNNDIGYNITELATTVFGNTRTLVTHGHRLNVRRGLGELKFTAQRQNCGLVFFGHSHTYTDVVADGVHFINPGALCNGSYAMVVGDGTSFMSKQCLI